MSNSAAPYIGILATAGSMLCLIAICTTIVRFKELGVQRIIATLEWLVTNGPARSERYHGLDESGLNSRTEHTWVRLQPLFELSMSRYVKIVWNASLRDLYWANRFGTELQRLSLFPLSRDGSEDIRGARTREESVMTHIRDFLIIVDRVFQNVTNSIRE